MVCLAGPFGFSVSFISNYWLRLEQNLSKESGDQEYLTADDPSS